MRTSELNACMRPTLVNVCGTERSGSTLLDLMLGSNPGAFSCGEVYAMFRPYRRHHFLPKCSCGESPCPIWSRFAGLKESEFHRLALRITGKSFIIDSSKDLAWVIDNWNRANAQSLRCVNLVIYKPPIQLAHSLWKRGQPITRWRGLFLSYYSYFLSLHVPFASVSYNDLMEAPDETRNGLFRLLEMGPDVTPSPDSQSHHLFGSPSLQTRNGLTKIDTSHELPASFIDEFYRHHDQDDPEIDRTLNALAARSFKTIDPNSLVSTVRISRKPRWYYKRRLWLAYRRFKPLDEPTQ